MKIEHLKKFVGLQVIVQLKEAMALGAAAGTGRLVPLCNAEGDILCKDGSIARDGTTPDELQMRVAWPIKVQRDEGNRPEFRFAIEDAVIALEKSDAAGAAVGYHNDDAAVHIMYGAEGALLELTVTAEQITGITLVRTGPIEETQPRIVRPD